MDSLITNTRKKQQHISRRSPAMHVLLCDDDPIFLSELRRHLTAILHKSGLDAAISACCSAEEINQAMLQNCDIAILDIDFGHGRSTGLDTARRLRAFREDAVILFVTNYVEYAPEGYEVQAFRYILKKDLGTRLEAGYGTVIHCE